MLEYCTRGHLLQETRRCASNGNTYCSVCRTHTHKEWEYDVCFSALDFHHIDPAEKKGQISNLICDKAIGSKEVIDELKNTVTLCGNCHAELYAGLWKLEELISV